MRGSVEYQVREVWRQIDGIGTSKAESRRESGLSGQSGHSVSGKVHSLEYKDEIIRTARDLALFAKAEYGIRDMQAITGNVVKTFIENKIDGGVTYRTASTYISHLEKIRIGLESMGAKVSAHENLFGRQSLIEARTFAREHAIGSEHVNRAYVNPQAIISRIESDDVRLAARLQFEAGLRVTEATRFMPGQLLGNDTIRVQGKGGYQLEKQLSPGLYRQLEQTIGRSIDNGERGWRVPYEQYRSELQLAAKEAGEKWNGTHGLRYNYAQELMERYQEQGYSREEALKLTSEEIGHHRPEITEHYLR